MGLKEDLEQEVAQIFRERWSEREGQQVPEPEDLKLGNDAVKIDATVLYADMSDSTKLVDTQGAPFAAEVYKAYLTCAARIIRDNGGAITAYDGDRIMAVFIGDTKNTNAAIAALKLNYAVLNIINPTLSRQYPNVVFRLGHVVGIDSSPLLAARIGIRKYNDIVWIGRAANYAAKMAAIKNPNKVFISDAVFQMLRDDVKNNGTPRQLLWEACHWPEMNNMSLHRSHWTWSV
jgi:class 3 adenylate cyclase